MITPEIISATLLMAVFFFVLFGGMLIASATANGKTLTRGTVYAVICICALPIVFGSVLSIALFIEV